MYVYVIGKYRKIILGEIPKDTVFNLESIVPKIEIISIISLGV